MLLNDSWWGVGDFYLSESGFSGCCWMIVFWKLVIFICLNQDFQDLRIFRMLLDDCFLEVGDFYLSESGCPGFEDFQDVVE
ncbi:MAG: hypothetical protein PT118_24560 [Aphanizomenon gracile PMC644.10]|nr:hypothetical protein [Aphanizomenon gracile PMC644.10]